MMDAQFKLYYWPLPFRGSFVSYMFAYADVLLEEESDYKKISSIRNDPPSDQPAPFMAPPLLIDKQADISMSQMPAIVMYVAKKLNLMPTDHEQVCRALKVVMDCNDLLMEICRYNGSKMWEREDWVQFRQKRLQKWFKIFEESLARGHFGAEQVHFADVSVYALFGNLTRCLPDLRSDLESHAKNVSLFCDSFGERPSLKAYVERQTELYGQLYCGGQIEKSIRKMLDEDRLLP